MHSYLASYRIHDFFYFVHGSQCTETLYLLYTAMGIRKKNTAAILKVRYGSITTAKIFKHGNYLK